MDAWGGGGAIQRHALRMSHTFSRHYGIRRQEAPRALCAIGLLAPISSPVTLRRALLSKCGLFSVRDQCSLPFLILMLLRVRVIPSVLGASAVAFSAAAAAASDRKP